MVALRANVVGMKLPAAERAVVDVAKARDYLLSTDHPVGTHKAEVFAGLGYDQSLWERLQADLLKVGVGD